jgi:predicted ribosomally synthesized peptide with nif11-like leader
MSKENLERFMTQVADREELQARIGDGMDADSLISLGAEHGCEFSADDLTAGAELSDEELDSVAGGGVYIKLDGVMARPDDGAGLTKFRIGRRPQGYTLLLDRDGYIPS